VLVIIGVSSMREAISIANNSKYGLAASIWTNDLDEAHQISRELQAGIVHVNSYQYFCVQYSFDFLQLII
jgi:acyl-CoA reductase-like NAD-dependent aldehyde dehydrogenase